MASWIKDFFSKMISGSDEVSSKRFASLFTLVNVIILAYIATFHSANMVTPQFMFESLCWLVAGGLGLTVAENIFGKKKVDTLINGEPVDDQTDTTVNTSEKSQ